MKICRVVTGHSPEGQAIIALINCENALAALNLFEVGGVRYR